MTGQNNSAGQSPAPPEHLSSEMRNFYAWVCSNWPMDRRDHLRLQTACEAWDRMTQARRLIHEVGLTYEDSAGNPRQHPATKIEKEARGDWLRSLRELGLDLATSGSMMKC